MEFHDLYPSPNIIRGDQITENEMGGACSTRGGEEEHRQTCGGGIRRKETTLKTWASMGGYC